MMTHDEARALLAARETSAALDAHLAGCEPCRAHARAEAALDAALDRLPFHAAPPSLRRKLARLAPAVSRPRRRWAAPALAATAVAAALLLWARPAEMPDALSQAFVEEHLRVLDGSLPLQVVSSGIHEVRPWFQGKLDLSPRTAFGGDAETPLQGGAVASVAGHQAAALVFKRRLHVVTLLVLRADAVPSLPSRPAQTSVRGFHVVTWREGDLAYALASDLDARELQALAARIRG